MLVVIVLTTLLLEIYFRNFRNKGKKKKLYTALRTNSICTVSNTTNAHSTAVATQAMKGRAKVRNGHTRATTKSSKHMWKSLVVIPGLNPKSSKLKWKSATIIPGLHPCHQRTSESLQRSYQRLTQVIKGQAEVRSIVYITRHFVVLGDWGKKNLNEIRTVSFLAIGEKFKDYILNYSRLSKESLTALDSMQREPQILCPRDPHLWNFFLTPWYYFRNLP